MEILVICVLFSLLSYLASLLPVVSQLIGSQLGSLEVGL